MSFEVLKEVREYNDREARKALTHPEEDSLGQHAGRSGGYAGTRERVPVGMWRALRN